MYNLRTKEISHTLKIINIIKIIIQKEVNIKTFHAIFMRAENQIEYGMKTEYMVYQMACIPYRVGKLELSYDEFVILFAYVRSDDYKV